MKGSKQRNEGTENTTAGRLVDGSSTAESDIGVLFSTEPLKLHEYVRSPRFKSSLNAVYDDPLHAPSLYEQENESFTSTDHETPLQSPALDLNHDNLSNNTDVDFCAESSVEIGFDWLREGYVGSRSTDLAAIQEEDEGEIHDLDNEPEASSVKCSFGTDKGKDNKLQSDHNSEDGLELIDQGSTLLAPSITRWSDEDMSGHQEELSACDLVRRLAQVNMRREMQMSRSKRFLKRLPHKGEGWSVKDRILKALRKFPTSTKMKMSR